MRKTVNLKRAHCQGQWGIAYLLNMKLPGESWLVRQFQQCIEEQQKARHHKMDILPC